MSELVLKGIPAASGIAYGPAFILDSQEFIVPKRIILEDEIESEIARFQEALGQTRREIIDIKNRIEKDMGAAQAKIFEAHLMVLDDPSLLEQVATTIRLEKSGSDYAFAQVMKAYTQALSKIQDEYLQDRVTDMNDIAKRVLKHLMEESRWHDFENFQGELAVVAHDLSPSDAVSMYNKKIVAFVTDIGGRTSHTAIIAKSLGVPAVVGLKDATLRISNRDSLLIDGKKGLVIVNPTPATRELYAKEQIKIAASLEKLEDVRELSAQTLDGKKVLMMANLELASELPMLKKYGGQGVGLYRTEFLFMNRLDLPSEEEQFLAYKNVVETMAPLPVTIRTLDLGGDKFISSVHIPKDMAPFLGVRAIRFCLERQDIFKVQLRAILRASMFGQLQMMYPMITGVGELRQANAVLEQVKESLTREHIDFDPSMKIGVMIEVPSAVMTADMLAKEADFFSIGTNDLVQYSLAVDRVSEKTALLYEPAHPAILRMIQRTVDAGHNEGISVSVCGEMASDVVLAFLLVGLGVDHLSMSPSSIPGIKRMIRGLKFSDIAHVTMESLSLSTGAEVEEYVGAQLHRLNPNL
jgi:phosphotransferase system enzyme I (PtsI)